jgi:pyrroline-5-carboxylate reductase
VTEIGFIGGGKMAEALLKGIHGKGFAFGPELRVSKIFVSEINKARLQYLKKDPNIAILDKKELLQFYDNKQVAKLSEVVILAVKPQDIPKVVEEIEIDKGKLVISIAAGISLNYLQRSLPGAAVIRAMPNNPALVSAGITSLAQGNNVTQKQLDLAKRLFESVGEVIVVEEKLMDAVTGLSGSGPAYVYLMIEALTKAGEELQLSEKQAKTLAIETVLGAAKTAKETGKPAKELREMVTSPGGTTMEGLKVLNERKFSEALIEAVKAAAAKSKKLSQ